MVWNIFTVFRRPRWQTVASWAPSYAGFRRQSVFIVGGRYKGSSRNARIQVRLKLPLCCFVMCQKLRGISNHTYLCNLFSFYKYVTDTCALKLRRYYGCTLHNKFSITGLSFMIMSTQAFISKLLCRGNPGLMLNELVGFTVPESTLEKMKIQMQSMRTDGPKTPKSNKPKENPVPQQVRSQRRIVLVHVREFFLFFFLSWFFRGTQLGSG